MAYQALYRKYRPRHFRDVVGQNHITTILKNQIQAARTSHAYLFCGSRGTGKTSTAKIFARAINCLTPHQGEACGTCAGCTAIERENVDIIEIDAASNNGVDDVRALIEQARFTPLHLKYKVYIIDEVHMLSGAASNALLKTLEEPPAHVLFLLATTEPQKLLATVISRCQRFDFKRLSVRDIADTLKSVLDKAGAEIEEEGLLIIARAADGGMRDALSLADQCIAFSENVVTAGDVYDVLGSMNIGFLFDIADALIACDASRALRHIDELVSSGRDLLVFCQDMMQHMRALLFAKACGDCRELLDCTAEVMARYNAQAERASMERLLRAMELLSKAQLDMRWLGRPRVLMETVLVRICRPEDERDVTALMDRVSRLEALIEKGLAAAPAAPAPPLQAAPLSEPAIAPAHGGDRPPWQTDTPEPSPAVPLTKAEPEPIAEPAPTAQSKPKAEPEEGGNATKPGSSADRAVSVWDRLRSSLKTINMSLYIVSSGVQSAQIEGDAFVIVFPQAKESSYNMFTLPRTNAQIKQALSDIDDKLQLVIRKSAPETIDAQTRELREVFGDKLKIID